MKLSDVVEYIQAHKVNKVNISVGYTDRTKEEYDCQIMLDYLHVPQVQWRIFKGFGKTENEAVTEALDKLKLFIEKTVE